KNKSIETTTEKKIDIQFENDFCIFCPKTINEYEFQQFQFDYQQEVKENYLFKQIICALEKIKQNQTSCILLKKQMESLQWAKENGDFGEDIVKEFNAYVKILQSNFNVNEAYSKENWESLLFHLPHISIKDMERLKQ